MKRSEIAVKYCGGCNPCFDRRAAVIRLEERLGHPLEGVREGGCYDTVFVICGCSARCADCTRFSARRTVVIDGPKGAEAALW